VWRGVADKACGTPTGGTNGLDFRGRVFLRTVTQNWVVWYTCVPICGFLVPWIVPRDVSHTQIWFFMNLPPRGVVPHTVSHVATRSVVLPLLPAAGFTSAAPHSSQPPLLQLFPRMQVSSGRPFCPIASPVSAPEPPSSTLPVSDPEPPALTPSLLPHHLPPDNNAVETAINSTESGAPYLGAFALSFKSQVLNHASRCSWTQTLCTLYILRFLYPLYDLYVSFRIQKSAI